jgi:hypothetical protein
MLASREDLEHLETGPLGRHRLDEVLERRRLLVHGDSIRELGTIHLFAVASEDDRVRRREGAASTLLDRSEERADLVVRGARHDRSRRRPRLAVAWRPNSQHHRSHCDDHPIARPGRWPAAMLALSRFGHLLGDALGRRPVPRGPVLNGSASEHRSCGAHIARYYAGISVLFGSGRQRWR